MTLDPCKSRDPSVPGHNHQLRLSYYSVGMRSGLAAMPWMRVKSFIQPRPIHTRTYPEGPRLYQVLLFTQGRAPDTLRVHALHARSCMANTHAHVAGWMVRHRSSALEGNSEL